MKRFANVPLGMIAPDMTKPHLKLERYLKPNLPAPPESFDGTAGIVDWGMLGNGPDPAWPQINPVGDCAICTPLHQIMAWLKLNGVDFPVTPEDAIALYSAITGYNPDDPTTDQGSDPDAVLAYWRDSGMLGHKIGAWASIDPKRIMQFKFTISAYRSAQVFWALPRYFQQFDGDEWGETPEGTDPADLVPGSWGMHSTMSPIYTPARIGISTWGEIIWTPWNVFMKYATGGRAVFSTDILNGTTPPPTGFDAATLVADLPLVAGC